MLLVPAIYLGTAPRGGPPPAFDLSSATHPSAFHGPKATWLSSERIVLEPEVVPYGPPTTAAGLGANVAAPRRAEKAEEGEKSQNVEDDEGDDAEAELSFSVPSTTTTTAPPVATTTTLAPTTTTSVPVLVKLPPALTPVGPAGTGTATRTDRGSASWFDAPEATCAHVSIPKGTEVTVTRTSTGASTTCIVDDWGPADTTRIIDLSLDTFEQLAPPEAGLIDVTIEW